MNCLQENVSLLILVIEKFLASPQGAAICDAVRKNIAILNGTLAKHLDKDDPKVRIIVKQLISALSSPSQEVTELKTLLYVHLEKKDEKGFV
ncbi:hypothetical protein DPMN_073548 [Dreissena polymorpha]|uniref:Uncharacterized protein n=1 Tax=Dreissena polymorpha TaxID=45954 RepID=A0A9D4BZD4_DREPO|nr:hypothetical protein DPMN_073548 [Dreissena polymorpha]